MAAARRSIAVDILHHMKSWMRAAVVTLTLSVGSIAAGCASLPVHVAPAKIHDESALTPAKPSYKSVMVLPPRGSERGAATELGALEKELLRRGIRVVSSGVTGRVVVEQTESGRGTEGATSLSDLERALVLAKKSNAEGLLQVSTLEWRPQVRHYVRRQGSTELELVSADEYVTHRGVKLTVKSPELKFEGKLIDVESGEIVASVALAHSVADVTDREVVTGGFNSETIIDSDGARDKVSAGLLSTLAEKIAVGGERKVAPAVVAEAKPEKKEADRADVDKADAKKADAKKKPAAAAPAK